MFILYAVILGLVVGLLAGGRLGALGDLKFRWPALVVLGLVTQIILFSDPVAERIGALGPPIYVASTLLAVAAVVRNLAIPGFALVAAGAASNLAAIVANGGFMPAAPGALAALGKSEPATYSNSSVVAQPALAPLIDLFAMPPWLPFANIFSLGDVLLGLGIGIAIVATMRRGAPARLEGRPA